MRTVFFYRRANAPWHHSIEELFGTITGALPPTVEPVACVMKRNSTGLWNRLVNIIDAARHQGEINHITGDVHYIALLMKKSRTLLTIHDLRILSTGNVLKRAVLKFFWFTMPSRRVACITVISEFIKQDLIRKTGIPAEKIVVVHDCLPGPVKAVPRPFHKNRPVILQVGTTPNKNLERVIPALAGLEVTLVILGKLTDAQTELLNSHAIDWQNHVNLPYAEVTGLYRNADIVLFASLYEGFGLPILEANAAGRPVIAGNNSSLPEVAGDAALLIDAERTEAIREAVVKLTGDETLRERLVKNGFENVKRFLPEKIGREYAAIYERMMAAG
jgi:glycosyltransferase involved in cell wall biosynthesis